MESWSQLADELRGLLQTKLIRNGNAKGRIMASAFRWVDGSYLLFVEPRLIGNLDVVSVRSRRTNAASGICFAGLDRAFR